MKKSQMQMNETILVLFIFFLILIFALIFVSKIQNVKIERLKYSNENLEMIQVSKLLKKLPELSCSLNNVLIDNCYDLIKITAFKELLETRKDYFVNSPLVTTNITVYLFDPFKNADVKSWNIYDRPLNNSNVRKMQFPITLYDPLTRTNSFGILEIGYYKR
jgi:hypothetical protein